MLNKGLNGYIWVSGVYLLSLKVYGKELSNAYTKGLLIEPLMIGLIVSWVIVLILMLIYYRSSKVFRRTLLENKRIKENLECSYRELELAHEELLASEDKLHDHVEALEIKKEELRVSRERYRLAASGAEFGIWEWDFSTDKGIYLSSKAKELLGLHKMRGYVSLFVLMKRVLEQDRLMIYKVYREHIERKTDYLELQFRTQMLDGKFSWIKVRGKALFDAQGQLIRIAGSINNNNKEKITEAKIHKLAYFDELTGLPNRNYFLQSLQEEIKKLPTSGEDRISVFVIDLDNFNGINETLGYSYGDKVLKKIALRLQHKMGMKDVLARFGGDEFIFYRKGHFTHEQLNSLAEQLTDDFKEGIYIGGLTFVITVSIGIAVIPEDDTNYEGIIKCADMAMYEAKKDSRNSFMFYNEKLSQRVIRRIELENDLRQALNLDQFKLEYQPKLDLKANRITGFEALIRWYHPVKGLISPAEFIPIAEEIGSIIELGDWVIKEAMYQLKAWHDEGYTDLNMSINLSANQFKDIHLKQTFEEYFNTLELDPKCIEVEITETAALSDINYAYSVLKDLKNIGIKVALDDFGTGYSSLNYLKRLPINNLKIDKSFIDDIMKEHKGEEIIRSIIALSHAYGIKVIAEGVENDQQLDFLRNEQCDEIQGYFVSRPLPADKAKDILSLRQF